MASSQGLKKKKIAILGGGLGALTTAFELTAPENPRSGDYEVTVYQIGWRVGGKGASGRNMKPEYGYRIEEHGLHVFYGCYDNAFRLMQKCYREMGRPSDAPLATWKDAFKPASVVGFEHTYEQRWNHWLLKLPRNDKVPGEGGLSFSPEAYVEIALEAIFNAFDDLSEEWRTRNDESGGLPFPALWLGLAGRVVVETQAEGLKAMARMLQPALRLAGAFGQDSIRLTQSLNENLPELAWWLGGNRRDVGRDIVEAPQEVALTTISLVLQSFSRMLWSFVKGTRKTAAILECWTLVNFLVGNLRGVIQERILTHGFDSINDEEYKDWLEKYLVDDDGLTLDSPLTSALYGVLFAYERGSLENPNLEAGAALRTLVRLFLTYKGAFLWKMQAGMGDVIFAPLYQVLRQRGVKFQFFHRVESLRLSRDQKRIEAVEMERQVRLKPEVEARGGYEPLVDVKGLPCWPAQPLYEQIVEGEELASSSQSLESYTDRWRGAENVEVRLGRDFDEVVLGISLGALPDICRELAAASEKWRDMFRHVKTVRTQALQLWLKPTLRELGWKSEPPVLTSYDASLINSWADMEQTLAREAWPASAGGSPRDIAYFCGTMEDAPGEDPGSGDPRSHQVKETALDFLKEHVGHLWPQASQVPGEPDSPFNWDLLVDNRPQPGQGQERLDSQYWASITNPSDRYVLSVAGSSRYRLKAGESGFENLYLTGDWTDNTFNIGSAEATVMSGMAAANAISGTPKLSDIVGWRFGTGRSSKD